jgi:hypothetical protein
MSCNCTLERVGLPDWILSRIVDWGPGTYYRFSVSGTNLNHPIGCPDREFYWSVPDDPRTGPDAHRYDCSGATVETVEAKKGA